MQQLANLSAEVGNAVSTRWVSYLIGESSLSSKSKQINPFLLGFGPSQSAVAQTRLESAQMQTIEQRHSQVSYQAAVSQGLQMIISLLPEAQSRELVEMVPVRLCGAFVCLFVCTLD